jgi:hypothetical protein
MHEIFTHPWLTGLVPASRLTRRDQPPIRATSKFQPSEKTGQPQIQIIVDEDENLTYEPVLAVAGIHAHLGASLPDRITPETKLPRREAGQVSNSASLVNLTRAFSKLPPALARAIEAHAASRRIPKRSPSYGANAVMGTTETPSGLL